MEKEFRKAHTSAEGLSISRESSHASTHSLTHAGLFIGTLPCAGCWFRGVAMNKTAEACPRELILKWA